MKLHGLNEKRFSGAVAGLDHLDKREKARVQQEQERGTAFFSFSPETKLQGRELFCCTHGPLTFGDVAQCFLLKRLDDYRFMTDEVKLMGEFYYAACRGRTCSMPTICHCVVKKHLHIHAPLYNQRRLEEYLQWKKAQANREPQATGKERLAGWLASGKAWALSFARLPIMAVCLLASFVLIRETQGNLQGFVAIDGVHYPPIYLRGQRRPCIRADEYAGLAGGNRATRRRRRPSAPSVPQGGYREISHHAPGTKHLHLFVKALFFVPD